MNDTLVSVIEEFYNNPLVKTKMDDSIIDFLTAHYASKKDLTNLIKYLPSDFKLFNAKKCVVDQINTAKTPEAANEYYERVERDFMTSFKGSIMSRFHSSKDYITYLSDCLKDKFYQAMRKEQNLKLNDLTSRKIDRINKNLEKSANMMVYYSVMADITRKNPALSAEDKAVLILIGEIIQENSLSKSDRTKYLTELCPLLHLKNVKEFTNGLKKNIARCNTQNYKAAANEIFEKIFGECECGLMFAGTIAALAIFPLAIPFIWASYFAAPLIGGLFNYKHLKLKKEDAASLEDFF